jgi:hypothetical protein
MESSGESHSEKAPLFLRPSSGELRPARGNCGAAFAADPVASSPQAQTALSKTDEAAPTAATSAKTSAKKTHQKAVQKQSRVKAAVVKSDTPKLSP